MAKKHPCVSIIRQAVTEGKITDEQAQGLIDDILDRLKNSDESKLANAEERIRQIGDEMLNENRLASSLARRNALLTIRAVRKINDFVTNPKFKTMGEGLSAYLNGTRKKIRGGRLSVDAQATALRNTSVGQLLASLEEADLVREFRSGENDLDIIRELWTINDPDVVNPSGSKSSAVVAKMIHKVQLELLERQNRAGAYIGIADNYVMRQTHDPVLIRKAGGKGMGEGSAEASFGVWSEFILPLLDHDKTFRGADPVKFLRGAHEGIITGVHGKSNTPLMAEFQNTGAMAKRISRERILHFNSPEGFHAYNQRFGSKQLIEGVFNDIRRSAHNVALMENLGPNPGNTFKRLIRDFKERARGAPDDLKQVQSLENEFLQGSIDQLLGLYDMPSNLTLHRVTRGLQAQSTLAKLGSVTISAIPDKAFFQSAATYQGISGMDAFIEQFRVFVPKSKAELRRIHIMGAGIDGFLGEVASRFTGNDNTSGRLFRLQQKLFKLNGMSWWNDIHKGSFAHLTASNLGAHADVGFKNLSPDIAKVLDLYNIDEIKWDMIRKTVYNSENGIPYITPDQLKKIPDSSIDDLVTISGQKKTGTNRQRMRDQIETELRAFITDQVDDAVVTPGNRERVVMSLNTRAGTVKGSAARLLMHFKSFPVAVFNKIIKREIYGHGSNTLRQWLLKDRLGNYRMLQLIAMTTVGGYVSISIKDALKGRTPRRLVEEDGQVNWKVFADAMQRGGGLGIYGDFLFSEYDRSYRNALNVAAGPIIGQIPEIAATFTDLRKGKDITRSAEKLGLDNTPFINLFYIRPILDYIILWNIQEMMSPGSLNRMERNVEDNNRQGFFIRPSEVVGR